MTTIEPPVELGDGLRTSLQGYGAMSLTDVYGPVSDEDALRTLTHAVDAGVTFIDTAHVYGGGRSELTISRLLATRRDEVQVATKSGIVTGGGVGQRKVRGDRAYVREQIETSLRRLGTDRVDLYYQHRVDPEVPIEETVGAMAELVQEGKVLHLGISEATGEELRRAASVHPIAAVQSEWSLISRDVEAHVVSAAVELGIGFVPYAPVGRKWLTGTFDRAALTEGDSRPAFPRFAEDRLAENQPVLEEVLSVAADAGTTPARLALAWLYAKGRALGLPVVPIPGTRFPEHVTDNLGAVEVELTEEQVGRLDALAGRVRGHRSFDPTWVSAGRE
ncbi:aldo/keto reductase [Nocardioides sp. YIM 152588]|uniref:aldo/keto reductase n=1 Tax=Nocardioides sp. YIM 152588 TaxID=3158259 RepID=UPI0032E46F78